MECNCSALDDALMNDGQHVVDRPIQHKAGWDVVEHEAEDDRHQGS